MSHAYHGFWKCYKTLTFWLLLTRCTIPCACHANIWTSKNGPYMVCFVHFDLEMCFAPQRRALFRHLNFQKWSAPGVLCTFWLGNVLRATRACTFSTSQVPKVVRTWCVLYILTWKCASRHNGVHFFISPLASWLRTRRFSEPTFQLNHWKNSESRLSYLFAHLHLLSSYSFSSLIFSLLIFLFSLPLPCSAFHLSILSEVWLLNFLRPCLIIVILSRDHCLWWLPPTLDRSVRYHLFGELMSELEAQDETKSRDADQIP